MFSQNNINIPSRQIDSGSIKSGAPDSRLSRSYGPYIIALGIIVLIGSLAATGCLFSSMGYVTLAIGGSGLLVGLGLVFMGWHSHVKTQVKPIESPNTNTPVESPNIVIPVESPNTNTPVESPNIVIPVESPEIDLQAGKSEVDTTRWLSHRELQLYSAYLATEYPQLAHLPYEEISLLESPTIHNINQWVFEYYSELCEGSQDKNLSLFLKVNEVHHTLLYIDRHKRTVEYYDSLVDFGDHSKIKTKLKKLAKRLSEEEPNKPHYKFECKINRRLQSDGYQCGPWTLYFLENRLKNPDIDFNSLNIEEVQKMIADYRSNIFKKTDEMIQARDRISRIELKAYEDYYGPEKGYEMWELDENKISEVERWKQVLAGKHMVPGQ